MIRKDENMPKVSIILPVYNTEKYIEKCLESIVNQTLKEIEIICINDCSSDSSWDILCSYAREDARFKLIENQENRGAYFSRNRGLDVACGTYIYFIDSDDWMELNALEFSYREMEKFHLDILYFGLNVRYESDELKKITNFHYDRNGVYEKVYSGPEIFRKFSLNNDHRVNLYGALFLHKFIDDIKLRFYEYTNHMDDLFYFQSLLEAKRVKCLRNQLYYRYVRKNSLMTTPKGIKNMRGRLINYCEMYKFMYAKAIPVLDKYIYSFLENEYISLKRLCIPLSGKQESKKVLQQLRFQDPLYDAVFQIAINS